MWDDQFEQLLRKFLPFLAPDEPLESGTALRDLGLDSLGVVELLGNLESTYDVRFLDGALAMENFENPGILWKTVEGLPAGTAA
ncbi:acyl carrier protein [Streptomyces telluris]|uniref:Acyl carrier protein n=2 Tax=Streptomyces TaxID=1883 RepID=A0A9X2LCD8_9ACTN|nr:acyl carrier protein [Streptomyces telluris]MCQ8768461.1 acyl carrier protein [Streptomyces telluris]NJP76599.1 acyl carrier protein [Streptomyces telluris]